MVNISESSTLVIMGRMFFALTLDDEKVALHFEG